MYVYIYMFTYVNFITEDWKYVQLTKTYKFTRHNCIEKFSNAKKKKKQYSRKLLNKYSFKKESNTLLK